MSDPAMEAAAKASTMATPAMVVTLRIQANAFSALVPFELTWLMRETADLLEAQSLALRKAREALEAALVSIKRGGYFHNGDWYCDCGSAPAKDCPIPKIDAALSLLPKEGE